MAGSFDRSGLVGLNAANGKGGSAFFSDNTLLHKPTTFVENRAPKMGAAERCVEPLHAGITSTARVAAVAYLEDSPNLLRLTIFMSDSDLGADEAEAVFLEERLFEFG
jgi:hypothetical protein